MHGKREAYERAGVREYAVLSTREPEFFWFEREDDKLVPLELPTDGVVRSKVFPGLWLNVAAALENDSGKLLETLNAGLADPGHAAFVADLAVRRAK